MHQLPEDAIAIVGIACRFGDVEGPDALWQALWHGRELVSIWDGDGRASWVHAGGVLSGSDSFDAPFFSMSPMEAQLTDPQHRVFLESCWHALEHAGHDPRRFPGDIGVFAGCGANTYLPLLLAADLGWTAEQRLIEYGNEKDFLTTRAAYRLGLTGPAVTVQTACSTSLTAVHLACQSLADFECDLALAGGSSVSLARNDGYPFVTEGILSPDGHCRPFDSQSAGTVPSDGVAVVALRRLDDAIAQGDNIIAIILGSAAQNDGNRKAGFSAPSVQGQVDTMRAAYAAAGVDPATIGYVEAHGTGTALGDPIEIAALAEVFAEAGTCYIGGAKGTLGHADTASGVAGLIVAALSLRHETILPVQHFRSPNRDLPLEGGSLEISARLRPWNPGEQPRRAAVNSIGVGGTNVHVILQEAPRTAASLDRQEAGLQAFPLSAATPSALDAVLQRLRDHAGTLDPAQLADAAFTLQSGRSQLRYRAVVTASDPAEVSLKIESGTVVRSAEQAPPSTAPVLALLFPGGGAQYAGMGEALYRDVPAFRGSLAQAVAQVAPLLDPQVSSWVESGMASGHAQAWIRDPRHALPALFLFEYALSGTLLEAGLRPAAMLGHSLGEYVAATIAGVFTLPGAYSVVKERARILASIDAGAMMSVPLAESELLPLIEGSRLDIAAVNGASQCVITGPEAEVVRLRAELTGRGTDCRVLPLATAAHSRAIDPHLGAFAHFLAGIELREPQLPFVSNVTGSWADGREVTSPDYWVSHLRQPVRFQKGLQQLTADHNDRLSVLEVGPGSTLTSLARRELGAKAFPLATTHRPGTGTTESEVLLEAMGALWIRQHDVAWTALSARSGGRRAHLPVYPFERKRYVPPPRPAATAPTRIEITAPGWRRLSPHEMPTDPLGHRFLVLGQDERQVALLTGQLRARGALAQAGDLTRLAADLSPLDNRPLRIVETSAPAADYDQRVESLALLARQLADQTAPQQVTLDLLTAGVFDVTGGERIDPSLAPYLALASVLPSETEIAVRLIDAVGAHDDLLWTILSGGMIGSSVALRGKHCWIPAPHNAGANLPMTVGLPEQPAVLITGGLGGVGSLLAGHLARTLGARIAVTDRDPGRDSPKRDQSLARVRSAGPAEVIEWDLTDPAAAPNVLGEAVRRLGRLDLVIHAAAVPFGAMLLTRDGNAAQDSHLIKAHSALALAEAMDVVAGVTHAAPLILTSSLATGAVGSFDYLSANHFLDLLALSRVDSHPGRPVVSIAWDRWRDTGMAQALERRHTELTGAQLASGLEPVDAVAAFERCLQLAGAGHTQITVRAPAAAAVPAEAAQETAVVDSGTEVISDLERQVAQVWAQALNMPLINVTDNFFELGGDSLVGMQIARRLRSLTGRSVSVKAMFTHPTVRSFTGLLEQGEPAGESARPVTKTSRRTIAQLRKEAKA